MKIAVLLGTVREGSRAEVVAKLVKEIGDSREDVEVIYVDPKTLNFPGEGEDAKDPLYSQATADADGFFIITPEYNHSFPGSLKTMLDSEYANYMRKSVVVAGVSSGPFGGVRAIKSLEPSLLRLGLVPCYVEVPNPNINDVINEDETISDKATIDRINKAYDEVVWFAKTLKAGRASEA